MTKSLPKSWGSDLYAGHKVKIFSSRWNTQFSTV